MIEAITGSLLGISLVLLGLYRLGALRSSEYVTEKDIDDVLEGERVELARREVYERELEQKLLLAKMRRRYPEAYELQRPWTPRPFVRPEDMTEYTASNGDGLDELGKRKTRYLIEEVVRQHPALSEIYAHSVNTMRIMTMLKMKLDAEHLFELLWKSAEKGDIMEMFVDGKEVFIKEVEITQKWNVGCITIDFRTDYT